MVRHSRSPNKSVAVLFGLNYKGTSSELQGCVNDVNDMARYLTGRYATIFKYTDLDPKTRVYTTKDGILQTLQGLSKRANAGEYTDIFIHYSGHGASIRDTNHDEADGRDETIIPSDCQRKGVITDDVLHSILATFPKECRIVMVVDSCHSGTIADLPYYRIDPSKPVVHDVKMHNVKCKCITISGCLDSQTSADAYNMKGRGRFNGALTSCLLDVLPVYQKVTDIQKQVQSLLKSKSFPQIPQVCASYDFSNDTLF
jgi:hypothetical protein